MTNNLMKRFLDSELIAAGFKKNIFTVAEEPFTFRTIIELINKPGPEETQFWMNRFKDSKHGTYIIGKTVTI